MRITIKSQTKLKKFAANLRKQLLGRIKKNGYDHIAEKINKTLIAAKFKSSNLKLKKIT